MVLIHATCVAIGGAGILIRGPSGSGKSDLALRLIDEGARLVADDYCEAVVHHEALSVTAPPAIAGKLEVRGVGIAELEHVGHVRVALAVDLRSAIEIPRLPDTATIVIEGVAVPWIELDARTASAPAKVRAALKMCQAAADMTPAARRA
jgi:HPr kinase/phosphorylase